MKIPLILGVALILAGCATETPTARASRIDDRQCRWLGAVPETQAYADCRLQLAADREARVGSPNAEPAGDFWVKRLREKLKR